MSGLDEQDRNRDGLQEAMSLYKERKKERDFWRTELGRAADVRIKEAMKIPFTIRYPSDFLAGAPNVGKTWATFDNLGDALERKLDVDVVR
jgi:hypothetical protein